MPETWKKLIVSFFFVLPLISGSSEFRKRDISSIYEMNNDFSNEKVNKKDDSNEKVNKKDDPYYEKLETMRRNFFVQVEEARIKGKYEKTFEALSANCKDGFYHTLPRDPGFILHRDPSDYLALAIEAHDPDAIYASKPFIAMDHQSSLLQRSLINLIIKEDTLIIETLGKVFPNIFTNPFTFLEPYEHLSGTSLLRIAIDQGKINTAVSMFKSVPVAVIGDFWQSIHSMRNFLMIAMENRLIRLRAEPGEPGIPVKVVTDIFYTCVTLGNLKALQYLHESVELDLKTMFEDLKGMSYSAMYLAANYDYSSMITFLGDTCPELYRIPSSTGMLPIHVAALNGHFDSVFALSKSKETLIAEVEVSEFIVTPFVLAMRSGKRDVADLILGLIETFVSLDEEIRRLAPWGIYDDNRELLQFCFKYNLILPDGRIDANSEYNLLEMAILGTSDPDRFEAEHCKVNCLEFLIAKWKELRLPFEVNHGDVRGSVLGLIIPGDMDAYALLVKNAKIDPNAPIIEHLSDGTTNRTTFLNRLIASGATEQIPVALKLGADPRIIDDEGNEALAIAKKYNNEYAISLFK